jgi:hypothetical protein
MQSGRFPPFGTPEVPLGCSFLSAALREFDKYRPQIV